MSRVKRELLYFFQSRTDVHQTAVPCVRNIFQFCSIAKITLTKSAEFQICFLEHLSHLKCLWNSLWLAVKCVSETENKSTVLSQLQVGSTLKYLLLDYCFASIL